MADLTEKELAVLTHIGSNGGKITQRQISTYTGISLGLINSILKNLAQKGCLKIKPAGRRKIKYHLTAKGLYVRNYNSYNLINRTIGEIKNIKACIKELVMRKAKAGNNKIGIVGNGELAEMVRSAALDLSDIELFWLDDNFLEKDIEKLDLLIDCRQENNMMEDFADLERINLIDYIITKL